MGSPVIVSLQVPYSENELQFLACAVQAALKTFRNMIARPDQGLESMNSSSTPEPSPTMEVN